MKFRPRDTDEEEDRGVHQSHSAALKKKGG